MPEKDLTLVLRVIQSVRRGGLWFEAQGNVHILGKLSICSFLSIYVLQLVALIIAKDDPARMFECSSVIFFCGMGILKLLSLHKNRDSWMRLLNRMEQLENEQRMFESIRTANQSDDEEVEEQDTNHVRIYTDRFKRTSIILLRIYGFTAVIYILSPFIEYELLRFLESTPEDYPHILPGWNPLDKKHVAFYVVMVLVEAVAAIYCVFMHVAFDSTAIGVMIFVCGQFSSLKLLCSTIGGRGRKCTPNDKRDAKAHSLLIKCHHTHMILIKSIEELDKLLRNILGTYFFLSTLTLCTVALRLTSEQMSVMQIISLLQYMCATLTQLFLFCSYGDAVFNEHHAYFCRQAALLCFGLKSVGSVPQVDGQYNDREYKSSVGQGEGPFSAALWCLSPKLRRELAILGFGMMLPRKLHAGPFNTVDLPTFIQIVRAAYSYYAVLGKSKAI